MRIDRLPFAGGAAFLLSPVSGERFRGLIEPLWVSRDGLNIARGKILWGIRRRFAKGLQKPGLDQNRDVVIMKAKNESGLLRVEPSRKSRKSQKCSVSCVHTFSDDERLNRFRCFRENMEHSILSNNFPSSATELCLAARMEQR